MSFDALLETFRSAAIAGDGESLASLFTEDGIYHDGFYGAFRGRREIARMLTEYFHRDAKDFSWDFTHRVRQGDLAYASYDFSYVSRMKGAEGRTVRFEGFSRFTLKGELIALYEEKFDRGPALLQLGFTPERLAKILGK
jgi:ketosteroid isomerase-like protein